jgi:tRNA(adenine34) deaminase
MSDEIFMQQALAEARQAAAAGEVPVGAVVVRRGEVIGRGHNRRWTAMTRPPMPRSWPCAKRGAGAGQLPARRLRTVCHAGALRHVQRRHAARPLKRVVFGAPDPKTGAAGSVLNLFAEPRLNHQTPCRAACWPRNAASCCRTFFRQRRAQARRIAARAAAARRRAAHARRERFDDLPGYPWQPRYVSDLPALGGLRLHYLDEGGAAKEVTGGLTWLCLHGNPPGATSTAR